MIITKVSLNRRTFMRGVGATVALPFLDAMVPALSAATSASAPERLGFVYVPNGMFLPNFHPAGEGGTAFELTPILKPLEGLRDQVVVVSGLSSVPTGFCAVAVVGSAKTSGTGEPTFGGVALSVSVTSMWPFRLAEPPITKRPKGPI